MSNRQRNIFEWIEYCWCVHHQQYLSRNFVMILISTMVNFCNARIIPQVPSYCNWALVGCPFTKYTIFVSIYPPLKISISWYPSSLSNVIEVYSYFKPSEIIYFARSKLDTVDVYIINSISQIIQQTKTSQNLKCLIFLFSLLHILLW